MKDSDKLQELPADSWQTLVRFLPYLWPADRPRLRVRIAFAIVLILLAKAVTLSLPFFYKRAVDIMGETHPAQAAIMAAVACIAGYVLGRFAALSFDNLRNITFERVGQEATRTLAEDVFARLHQLSLRFHLSRRTGEVTKIIERGTKSIDTMLYFLLFNIVPTAIELLAVAVIFQLQFGWGLVGVTALAVILYSWTTRKITDWRTALRDKMNALDGQALAHAVDSLLNYETVKYFSAEEHEQQRYARATRAYADAAVQSENSLGLLNIAQGLIINLLLLAAMGWAVYGWTQGRYTAGDLVFIQTYLTQLFRPLDMLGVVYRTIRQGLIDMAAMFTLIDTRVEVRDKPGAPTLVIRQAELVFDNVTFGYDLSRTVIHNLSFMVPAGARVAIVGPSGAGKSTIARLIFRFYDPTAGRILIDGQDIASVTQSSLRAQIGIVPQDSVLFNETIGYNIAYGRADSDYDAIMAAAEGAALGTLLHRLPKGLETQVGERGLKLSGGEKQRVAIARTLLKDPPILLLDEATSALDTQTERDILTTLHAVTQHRTSLTIAHRLSTIADSDHILVLAEGRLAEQGTHGQLLNSDGLYTQMWHHQAREDHEAARAD